jgi:protein-L-isoaspartate(D-aspartate) O-methyltransferase
LALRARDLLDQLQYQNVVIKQFDGTYGWKECSPFDAILVAAGSPDIPQGLIDQLADGGRLVIPVGDRKSQTLKKALKTRAGLITSSHTPCVFVPLIGTHGWRVETDNGG